MSTRVVDQVDTWDGRSFSGGYRELHDLADSDFSGVVRAGGAELYMTRGVAVGIRHGDIEDFEGSGTVYEAPAEALPLLAIMQERNDEVRAKYYTEDTSISKVDKTLSDGGFTGFVELSENVLSGDYYLVYHAGTSMSVAYVGESSRLIHGDEAFETANDEVGIYEVRPTDIEPVEIPEPEDDDAAATPTGGTPAQSDSPADNGEKPEPEPEKATESGPSATQPSPEPSDGPAATTETETEQETGADTEQSQRGQHRSEAAEATDQSGERDEATGQSGKRDEAAGQSGKRDEGTDQSGERDEAAGQSGKRDGTTAQATPSKTGAESASDQSQSDQSQSDPLSDQTASARTQPDQSGRRQATTRTGANQVTERNSQSRQGRAESKQTQDRTASPQPPQEPARSESPRTDRGRGRSSATSADLETKSIPSLDPSKTSTPDDAGGPGGAIPSPDTQSPQDTGPEGGNRAHPESNRPQEGNGRARSEPRSRSQEGPTPSPGPAENPAPPAGPQQGTSSTPQEANGAESQAPPPQSEQLDDLEAKLESKEETIEELETELESVTARRDELESERDELESERDELERERDELQRRVEELESELTRLEEELGAATDAEQRLTGEQALAGTDIFVRYRSKGKATLKKAHGSSTRRNDVNENLRLEKHTQFDSSAVSVGGQSYEEFLESTLEFQFVRWVVRELLFEIRDTGHEKSLGDLYDVLPLIDRAELAGVVDVTYTEDGQETQSQESFDVVLRDRMGNPLLAANLNDTREATTEGMMERLITSAERVGQSSDGFSGAFLVTESFFDPGALEVASDATQGGLLSRDKRKSFVNLSRKTGYHLCLVEARNENFHLAVPEL